MKFKNRLGRLHEHGITVISDLIRVVKSIKHVGALTRRFSGSSVEKVFICPNFETKRAFMKQCEHSLKANGGMLLFNQFGVRHHRRNAVKAPPHVNEMTGVED